MTDCHTPVTLRSRGFLSLRVCSLVTALACLAAACGIPVDSVEPLDASEHEELVIGTTSTTVPVEPPDIEQIEIRLFFVADNTLESVLRPLPKGIKINSVLEELQNGPLEDEKEVFEGELQTRLPPGLSPRLEGEGEVQRVVVNPEAGLRDQIGEEDGRLIVTQIVCTVLRAGREEITAIEIFDGEEAITLSDSDSQPIIGAATEADFDDCRTGAEERAEELELEAEANADSTTVNTDASESSG